MANVLKNTRACASAHRVLQPPSVTAPYIVNELEIAVGMSNLGSPTQCTVAPHGPDVPSCVIFVAGRRRGNFVASVERANIYAVHAQTSDASGSATPYIGRCEMDPATPMRPRAQVKYSKRFRAAYGHHRSRAGLTRRSSSTKTPSTFRSAPRRCIHINPDLPPRSDLLRPTHASYALHRHSAQTEPRGLTSKRRQDGLSSYSRPVPRANMCAVEDWSAEVVTARNPFRQTASRHRYARPRSRRISRSHPFAAAHYGTRANRLWQHRRGESITPCPSSADCHSPPIPHNVHRSSKQYTPNRESDRHTLPVPVLRVPHFPRLSHVSTTRPTQQRPLPCQPRGLVHSSQRPLMRRRLIVLHLIHRSFRTLIRPLGYPSKFFVLNGGEKYKLHLPHATILCAMHFTRTNLVNPHQH